MFERVKKFFQKSGKAAPAASQRVSVIAVAPPNAGKTWHWTSTTSREGEGSQREVKVVAHVLAGAGGGKARVGQEGTVRNGKFVPAANVDASESSTVLQCVGRDGRSCEIPLLVLDLPGEWVTQRKEAEKLKTLVKDCHLLVITLSPEFVFGDHTDDHVMKVFESCIQEVREMAAATSMPPFIALCYSKCDEYGFAPTSNPRLLSPKAIAGFGTKANKEDVKQAAKAMGTSVSGKAAQAVIDRTWRLYEQLLSADTPFCAYWVSAWSATPGFASPVAQGVHHVLADFARHLSRYRPPPMRVRWGIGVAAAALLAIGGFGWSVVGSTRQLAEVEAFRSWVDSKGYGLLTAQHFAEWRESPEWRESAEWRKSTVQSESPEAGWKSVVDLFGGYLQLNEAVSQRVAYATSGGVDASEVHLLKLKYCFVAWGEVAKLNRVMRSLELDREAELALKSLLAACEPRADATPTTKGSEVAGASQPVEVAGGASPARRTESETDAIRKQIEAYLIKEIALRKFDRISSYMGPDKQPRPFHACSTDRLLRSVFANPRKEAERKLNRHVHSMLLFNDQRELLMDAKNAIDPGAVSLVLWGESAIEPPHGESWKYPPWDANPTRIELSYDSKAWICQYQGMNARVVGDEEEKLLFNTKKALYTKGQAAVLQTGNEGKQLSLELPQELAITSIEFTLLYHAEQSDQNRVKCVFTFQGPAWAPAILWILGQSPPEDKRQWRAMIGGFVKCEGDYVIGNVPSENHLKFGDLQEELAFEALHAFFKAWAPRPLESNHVPPFYR